MLTDKIRPVVDRVAVPIGRGLGSVGLTANAITVGGTVVSGISAWLIATGHHLAAAWVLLLGSIADTLDGAVATATRTHSLAGAFLDSTLDRVSDSLYFAGAAWWYASQDHALGLGLTLAGWALAGLISYIRAKAESLGLTCRVGIAERWLRLVLIGVGLAFGFLLEALVVLVGLSVQTALQRLLHVFRQAQATGR